MVSELQRLVELLPVKLMVVLLGLHPRLEPCYLLHVLPFLGVGYVHGLAALTLQQLLLASQLLYLLVFVLEAGHDATILVLHVHRVVLINFQLIVQLVVFLLVF